MKPTTTDAIYKAMNARAEKIGSEIFHLTNLMELIGFAYESRRILVEIDEALSGAPEAAEMLRREVNSRREWCEFDIQPAYLLRTACTRLTELSGDVGDLPMVLKQDISHA